MNEWSLNWITTDTLAKYVALTQLHYIYFDPLVPQHVGLNIALSGWPLHLVAGATIVIELCYGLSLFTRRWRWVFIAPFLAMLVAVRVLMGPCFIVLILCHCFWIPWERLATGARMTRTQLKK